MREIRALSVKCDKLGRGCDWLGTVGGLEDHLTKCGSSPVPCPNKCKVDHLQLLRKSLKDHLETKCPNRAYSCEHCGLRGKYASIVGEHDGECEKKLIPCTNKCGLTMERGDMKKHIQTVCTFTEVPCKYHGIGCKVRKMRMWMDQHEEDDKAHLHMSLEMISKLDSKLTLSLEKIAKLDSILSSQMEKTAELDSSFSSQMEKTEKLDSSFSSQMEKTEKLDSSFSSQMEKTTKSMEKFDCTLSLQMEKTAKLDSLLSTMKKDSNTFGSTTFKMSEYGKKKKGNIIFQSESFYTSPSGYRMQIRAHPNGGGNGRGSHVSVFIALLEGPNDESLHWPFLGTMEIKLLNQSVDDGHHGYTLTLGTTRNMRPCSNLGYYQFLPHSKLSHDSARNTQYLMDDTLYFRVTVTTTMKEHRPWLITTSGGTNR